MANHAGYGAAAIVRQSVLQNAILIYHRAGVLPTQFRGESPVPDSTRPGSSEVTTIAWDLFVDAPQITLAAGDGVSVDVRIVGPLTLRQPHELAVSYSVKIDIGMRVRPVAVLAGGSLQLGFNYAQLVVNRFEVRTWFGPTMPEWLHTVMNSHAARLLAQATLRDSLRAGSAASPLVADQLIAQLNTLGLQLTGTTLKVFDGALGIGLSVSGTSSSSPLSLSGSADALVNFCPTGSNIAFEMHSDISTLLFMLTQGPISVQARVQAGIKISNLRFVLENPDRGEEGGHLRIDGDASKDALSVGFEVIVKPLISETRLGVRLYRFNIRHLPWWAHVLGILSAGIITPVGTMGIFSALVGALNVRVARSLSDTVSGAMSVDRTNTVTLPGTSAPTVSLRTNYVAFSEDGTSVSLSADPNWGGATRIEGPRTLGPSDPASARFSLVATGSLFHPADLSVRIRWWAQRIDTGATFAELDSRASDPNALELTLNLSEPVSAGATEFHIYCRVYRPEGAGTVEMYRGSTTLSLVDPLDRRHPFVRWRHVAHVPQVRVHLDGAGREIRVTEGYRDVTRQSRIHRTAVPGRCRFAHRYSLHVLPAPDPSQPRARSLEYLAELPFPRSELVMRRRTVCDYCFFGGPDKLVPLI